MLEQSVQWQTQSIAELPEWFVQAVERCMGDRPQQYLAQLLWQRSIRDSEQIAGFLDPNQYQPASPFEFGQEMHWAVDRLQQAYLNQEIVGVWGDFDADGVTSTAVLWDGLGQFFTQQKTLFYYIPNRLTESHGLSRQGIDRLNAQGCRLIITCDTGSTNLDEIEYARHLGIDIVITDHHTLLSDRPPVAAIINPRYLPTTHALASLSGVAVAYKLVEALYATLPDVPQPLEELLDLVAIGLIADLVELKGDCRYLAQRGIEQLQKQSNPATVTRPGIAKLLEFCKRTGDRPTDISFGLGPRINAVSRIQGDAHFCVELLTSQDVHLCTHLAEATELANARRQALQKEVTKQVLTRLSQLDLSTTRVIVLADEQWQLGVLGLVAGQVAQDYGQPTILLSTEGVSLGSGERGVGSGEWGVGSGEQEDAGVGGAKGSQFFDTPHPLAKGSARSINSIDLYELVKEQAHLLHRFGGHPFAAGLSLPVENIPLFTEAINQQLRQTDGIAGRSLLIDLTLTAAELGKELFQELKQLEPCGMGNPVPKLLIQNCWFENAWHKKIRDWKGGKVEYIKTEFELRDDSTPNKFAGVWWGHYKDELPQGRCDAVLELDSNNYQKRYEVRLIAVRPCEMVQAEGVSDRLILDWRRSDLRGEAQHREIETETEAADPLIMRQCPSSWTDFQTWFRRSRQENRPLAIAYAPPPDTTPQAIWKQLAGIAKYLARTGKIATRLQLLEKLELGDRALQLGLKTLAYLGFAIVYSEHGFSVTWQAPAESVSDAQFSQAVEQFFVAVNEEQFRRRYFYQVPLATIQAVAQSVHRIDESL